jgi:hypothetical protein
MSIPSSCSCLIYPVYLLSCSDLVEVGHQFWKTRPPREQSSVPWIEKGGFTPLPHPTVLVVKSIVDVVCVTTVRQT